MAKDTDIHARALRRFDDAVLPQQEIRALALLARRFVTIPGAQWEGVWGEQFENSIRVEIPKIGRAVRKIYTDYTQSRIVPDFRPDGKDGDEDTANLLDGLHRADSYRYKSQEARDNAVYEALTGGFGAYRLMNLLEDEYDKDDDAQRINPGDVIVDADQRVFFDPQSVRYDKSDARFAFVREVYTHDAYEAEFGKPAHSSWPDGVIRDSINYDWFTPDTVTVCEYYEVEDKREKVLIFRRILDGAEERVWEADLEEGELGERLSLGFTVEEQKRKRCRVHKYIMDGNEVLEDAGYIAGKRIPIVPVYGQRAYIDGIERFKGHVADRMDAQRLYNAQVTSLAEGAALSQRERPIFAAEQMPQNLADQWARADIDRHPYALVQPLRDEVTGQIISAGPIGYVKPPDVPPVKAAVLQIAANDLTEEDADGADTVKANTSAEAMDIAAARVDAKSALYLDNVRQSVACEGEIYLHMACDVYVEEGREVETMDADEGAGTSVLMQPVMDGDALKITNDLSKGRYKVVASVSEATATRRDKTVRTSLNMAEMALKAGDQELAQAGIITAIMNSDGEGIDDYHAFARKRGLSIGLIEPNEEEQAAMQEAAQGQQPDPMEQLAEAQSQEFIANAALKGAQVQKTNAETALTVAKTKEIVAEIAAPKIRMGRDFQPSL